MPVHSCSAYSVAKAALNHFTRALAAEEPVITTIAVRPGVVDTDMQTTIRRHGATGMPAEIYARFVNYHERDELLPPEVPGCALAVLAFHAPQEWSGAFLAWDSEDVQSLVRRYAWETGLPLTEELREVGLDDVADALLADGKALEDANVRRTETDPEPWMENYG